MTTDRRCTFTRLHSSVQTFYLCYKTDETDLTHICTVCPTSVCGVECSEGDDKEGGRIFPSIHQVREGPLSVTVTPQALDEAQPGGQTLDDGAQAVRVAVAYVVIGV